ncbi:unnamed protein product, partial [Didymodactylos carnosus]
DGRYLEHLKKTSTDDLRLYILFHIEIDGKLIFIGDMMSSIIKPKDDIWCDINENKITNINRSQNYFILLLNVSLNLNETDINMKLPHDKFKFYDNPCEYITAIGSFDNKHIYSVISSSYITSIIPLIHNQRQIHSIYIYGKEQQHQEKQQQQSTKIRGYYQTISDLCTMLEKDITECSEILSIDEHLSKLHIQTLNRSKIDSTSITCQEYIHVIIIDLICYNNEDDISDICKKLKLKNISTTIFNNINICKEFLCNHNNQMIFLILIYDSFRMLNGIDNLIHLSSIQTIYLLNEYKSGLKITTDDYKRMIKLFDQMSDLTKVLFNDLFISIKQIQYVPPFSILKMNDIISFRKMNSGDHKFLYEQFLIDILLEITMKDENENSNSNSSYIDNQFLFEILNRSFRTENINELLMYRHLIQDIHVKLSSLDHYQNITIVYRGQLMSNDDLKLFRDNIRKYVSFNTFLTVTTSYHTAMALTGNGVYHPLFESILFEIKMPINTHSNRQYRLRPFTDGNNLYQFSIGTTFIIKSIKLFMNTIWCIELEYSDINEIKRNFENELGQLLSPLTFVNFLNALNEYNKAESFFNYLLNRLPSYFTSNRSMLYNNMGLVYAMNNNTQRALEYYTLAGIVMTNDDNKTTTTDQTNLIVKDSIKNKTDNKISLKHIQRITDYSLALIYYNIANVYFQQTKYTLALKYCEKAILTADSKNDFESIKKCENMISTIIKSGFIAS